MALSGTQRTFRARGVSDSADSTNAFPGAMRQLANLVPDPANGAFFVPRPASVLLTDFTGSGTVAPAQINAMLSVGAILYGMIAETGGAHAGKDVPFAYNLLTGGFQTITIAGVLPTTPAPTGDWVPPTMAVVGTKVVITHPGYPGGATKFGWLDISGANYTAPIYNAGDTAPQALIAVPVAVAQFNGRAWYATNSGATVGVQFSDALNATVITNASQALTFNNGLPVTALGGLPLSSSTFGGIIQSLIAFQGDSNMVQISGDQTTANLTQNNLGIGVGTLAPNTICPTPLGLSFVAPDGLRIIDFLARVSEPVGDHGKGVVVPFISTINPSRMCAAFNQNVLRISTTNGAVPNQPRQEWWYDFEEKIWTGPHTFPAALIQPNQSSATNSQGFVLAAWNINAKLWQSQATPNLTSSYVENSIAMAWAWQTSLLPDNEQMAENAVIESMLGMILPAGQSVQASASDEAGAALGSVLITNPATGGAIWGSSIWGAFIWGASGTGYFVQYSLNWPNPLVFKQMFVQVNGESTLGFAIGNLYMRTEQLGYLTMKAS